MNAMFESLGDPSPVAASALGSATIAAASARAVRAAPQTPVSARLRGTDMGLPSGVSVHTPLRRLPEVGGPWRAVHHRPAIGATTTSRSTRGTDPAVFVVSTN